jgi:ABC-2 type transport system permease protein
MFASSMFYPLESLPPWLRTVSYLNPMTWHTDGLRFATIGIGEAQTILIEGTAFAVFLLLSFVAAIITLRRGILR